MGGVPVWLSRTGFSGELGFELFLRPEHADELWEAVEAAGATPYGIEVIEPLRVETGMIVTDYDYAEHERTPYDLGMDRVVALERARRVHGQGQAASRSRPTRRTASRRCGWRATRCPRTARAVTREGEEVGVLTSPAMSPKLGTDRPRDPALGRGRRRDARSRSRSATAPSVATVDVLAIYDPQKRPAARAERRADRNASMTTKGRDER